MILPTTDDTFLVSVYRDNTQRPFAGMIANDGRPLDRHMPLALQAPFLSAYDPVSQAEGSIDPLGLASTYDRLADAILPGITVRMRRPRFLTAVAVGAHISADIEPDTLASDRVTPPYLVAEWWIVEALARCEDQLKTTGGIPGIQKVQTCVRNQRPVSAPAYLKTPSVFGYTGIFRRLARHTRIITGEGRLDDAGHQLLEAWSKDQGFDGFLYSHEGPGASFRNSLRLALKDGLQVGHTSKRPSSFWGAIAQHLDPSRPGRRERGVLLELIKNRSGDPDEVRFIAESLRKLAHPLDFADEAKHLRGLRRSAPKRLQAVLDAVEAYETWCRVLTDAFDSIRYLASRDPARGASIEDFVSHKGSKELTQRLTKSRQEVTDNPLIGDYWPDRGAVLSLLSNGETPAGFFEALMQHHIDTQQRKPPDGKLPWLERDSRGRFLIRATYRLDEEPQAASPYVHEYRLPTLSRFLNDLGDLS